MATPYYLTRTWGAFTEGNFYKGCGMDTGYKRPKKVMSTMESSKMDCRMGKESSLMGQLGG